VLKWWCFGCVVSLALSLVALYLGVVPVCGRVCDDFYLVFHKLAGHSLLLN
jgi:hypothetical protein